MKKLIPLLVCLCLLFTMLPSLAEVPSVNGTVTSIDKYGHAILDITIEDFNAQGYELGDIVSVKVGQFEGDMPYLNGYYVDNGECMLRAYPGHTNIALSVNYGKFSEVAGVSGGEAVTISLKEKAGALTLQEINNLVYTYDINDYGGDEVVFANFRGVTVGEIAEGRLYRAASPIDNKYGRATYANKLVEEAGIKTVMNLANTDEEVAALMSAEGFTSQYYASLYADGKVIALGMPVNYASDEFAEGIVKGLVFLSEGETPFLVHCTEGKDRAGFTSMILEMLAGATADEIARDYMLSYVNYYGIEEGSERYEMLKNKNIMQMMCTVCGLEKGASLEGIDLEACARAYLAAHGMAEEAIDTLAEKLK